jgi:hypothetical protein
MKTVRGKLRLSVDQSMRPHLQQYSCSILNGIFLTRSWILIPLSTSRVELSDSDLVKSCGWFGMKHRELTSSSDNLSDASSLGLVSFSFDHSTTQKLRFSPGEGHTRVLVKAVVVASFLANHNK